MKEIKREIEKIISTSGNLQSGAWIELKKEMPKLAPLFEILIRPLMGRQTSTATPPETIYSIYKKREVRSK